MTLTAASGSAMPNLSGESTNMSAHISAAVLLILAVPTPTAMAIMGWSSAAMAKRYQHILDSIRRDVASQVGGLLWSGKVSPDNKDEAIATPACAACSGFC
jgi:hypothetical protein